MSAKKCIGAKCPYFGIKKVDNKNRFVCKTEQYPVSQDILLSEIEEAGREYNKTHKTPMEPCSYWATTKECSEREYKQTIAALLKQLQEAEIQPQF